MTEGFFDFRSRVEQQRRGRDADDDAIAEDAPMSVSELTERVSNLLKQLPQRLRVRGEVSNANRHRSSGHLYFTLKDSDAVLDCVMFRSDARQLAFDLEDGLDVTASGRVQVYQQRGRYQLYVSSLRAEGRGALELAFRKLHARLEAEGLFDPSRKRAIPKYPERIALVTSRAAAGLQDVLKVFNAYPHVSLKLFHVPVQGDGAAPTIAAALDTLSAHASNEGSPRFDAVFLGRGGGSLEDLWAFNEEAVARAIARCPLPVVTGIGHETDVAIADLVADYHAHTPTEAARVLVAHWRDAQQLVAIAESQMRQALRRQWRESTGRVRAAARSEVMRRPVQQIVDRRRERVDDIEQQLLRELRARHRRAERTLADSMLRLERARPDQQLARWQERIDGVEIELGRRLARRLASAARRVDALEQRLVDLGPESALRRGYALVTLRRTGKLLRRSADVRPGDVVDVRTGDGRFEAVAGESRQLDLFAGDSDLRPPADE